MLIYAGGVLKNMEADVGGGFTWEAVFRGGFQYGGGFRGRVYLQTDLGGACFITKISRAIPTARVKKKKVRQKFGSSSHSAENEISLFNETMTVLRQLLPAINRRITVLTYVV